MPLEGQIRYRIVKRGEHRVRLAFDKNGKVVEAKNLDSGEVHGPKEFAADRRYHD